MEAIEQTGSESKLIFSNPTDSKISFKIIARKRGIRGSQVECKQIEGPFSLNPRFQISNI